MRHRTTTHANLSKLWNLPLIPIQPVLTALRQQLSATTERKPGRTASSACRGFSGCCGTGEAALRPSDELASRLSGRLA